MSERRYKQRGYMESDRPEERREKPKGPRPDRMETGPRGRGLGAPTASVFRCRVCGEKHSIAVVPVDATCFRCNSDLHTCSNCVHFDTSRPNECRKPVIERVANKTKRNTCELFAPRTIQEFAPEPVAAASPRAAFDALFRKR